MSEAGVEELAMVAAGHAGDPGGGDVRADDGIPPSGGALEGGQLLRLAACGPGPRRPARRRREVWRSPAHQHRSPGRASGYAWMRDDLIMRRFGGLLFGR